MLIFLSGIKLARKRSSTSRFQSELSLLMHGDHVSTMDHTPSGKKITWISCMVSITYPIVNLRVKWISCYTPSALMQSSLILQSLNVQHHSPSFHPPFMARIFVLLWIHTCGLHRRSGLKDSLDLHRKYRSHGSRQTNLSLP